MTVASSAPTSGQEQSGRPRVTPADAPTASERGRTRSAFKARHSSSAQAPTGSAGATGRVVHLGPPPAAPGPAREATRVPARHISTAPGLISQLRGNLALLRILSSRSRPEAVRLDLPTANTASVLGTAFAARLADLFGIPAVVTPTQALVDWFDRAPGGVGPLARVMLTVDSARWVVTDETTRADLSERLLLSAAHVRTDGAGEALSDAVAPSRRWRA